MRLKIISFITLLLVIVSIHSCSKKDTTHNIEISNPEKLNQLLDHYVEEDYYPFIYARLEDLDGKLIYEHSAVNQRVLPNKSITKDSWIRIWSMSKIVTISILLDLVEDEILSLEDPVSKFIPQFKNLEVAVSHDGKSLNKYEWGNRSKACPIALIPNDSIMTVRHLINHKAGFYYATTGFECLDTLLAQQNLPLAEDSDDLISKLSKLPLVQHSGEAYFYGTNTTVLGIVAEKATGKSLNQLVSERITTPLKIDGLRYGLPPNENLLPTYTGRDSILRTAKKGELDIFGPDVPDYDSRHQLFLGGEGMLATADGYADFIRMLLRRGQLNGYRYLNKETVEEMYSPHTQLDNPYGYNGYNLWVSGDSMRIKKQGEEGLWIGGGYECTHFWADPKRNFVGLIMSQNNEVRSPGYNMNDDFRGALYQQLWESEK